ncbi:unnamed protein product [Linum trigynum]|uniref:Uncharacterized protein n=1 Tax=Linum trigynum TaxID=586398 RepID=A0AAV2GAQ4_9ROSI
MNRRWHRYARSVRIVETVSVSPDSSLRREKAATRRSIPSIFLKKMDLSNEMENVKLCIRIWPEESLMRSSG